ncbi:NAD+ diphosphatase [Lachnotalea glycerini]|uniref:NAD(+) diphosphatase n=1 Tax=Lachnotalea glycerini TaxID=1763509 RepID=A0A318EMS8_9FIRM|nr:NAD(+) diphosphatase [Lachnotalea glycerini]PXV86240.1 NAD+ diphosphatase [Lachnotalea glycerini]
MLQDIAPHIFNNQYMDKKPAKDDFIISIKEGTILVRRQEEIKLPTFKDFVSKYFNIDKSAIYLFSIDEINFFLVNDRLIEEDNEFKYENLHKLRTEKPMWMAFAAAVGGQLSLWYDSHKYCGRCAQKLVLHSTERALFCPNCSDIIYPTLAPSVIVAITNGNKLLMTKYAYGIYKNYALVAGYAEIGEDLEQTVRREVMEEVGLNVKNITYYKTQPWPFSGALLVGYFAEVDGDETVTLQESELSEATWFEREKIPKSPSQISLTSEMIERFRNQTDKNIE